MTGVEAIELSRLDAVETAARVRSGELSAPQVVAAAIERSEALAPLLNAVSACDYERVVSHDGIVADLMPLRGFPWIREQGISYR